MHLRKNNNNDNFLNNKKNCLLLWPFILQCNSKPPCYFSSEHGCIHNFSLLDIFNQGLQTLSKSCLGIWRWFRNKQPWCWAHASQHTFGRLVTSASFFRQEAQRLGIWALQVDRLILYTGSATHQLKTLGDLLDLPGSWFPHLQDGGNMNTHAMEWLWGPNATVMGKAWFSAWHVGKAP